MTVVVSIIAVRLIWMPLVKLIEDVTVILGNTVCIKYDNYEEIRVFMYETFFLGYLHL